MIGWENGSPEQIAGGFAADESGGFTCLSCGMVFEHGEIFRFGDRFFDAERAVKVHLEAEHPDRFAELLDSGKRTLSLTENQKELLTLFYGGLSDREIAEKLGVAPSTVRHQRFVFREKAKAAALYLAVWRMVEENKNRQADTAESERLVPVHKGAKMVDERYEITEEESKKILGSVFQSLEPLKLKVFSAKEKKKIVILRRLAQQFEPGRRYSESEVNGILADIYEDYATLRRYLIEYGYMDRTDNGSAYWRRQS